MMHAIATCAVGDDVLGDDPTVLALEAKAAEMLGKDAAMFVPSGTMANQCAIRAHTQPGDEIIAHEGSHIIHYEGGGPAVLSGCMIHGLSGLHGRFTSDQIRGAMRPDNSHFPRSRLLVVENTHNRGGGSVWPLAQLREVTHTARELGLATHMDGARVWNASVATGVSPREIASCVDTISACLSKGLGAPVGSVLAGPAKTIGYARRFRKLLGGGMRQSGLLAAGGLHALEHHVQRLAQDHANAKVLAEAIARTPGFSLCDQHEMVGGVRATATNIVLFDVQQMTAAQVCEQLKAKGILALPTGSHRVRFVTHLDVSADQCAKVAQVLSQLA
jgi:threonine aldolase